MRGGGKGPASQQEREAPQNSLCPPRRGPERSRRGFCLERARQRWPERVGKESGAGGPSLFAAKQEKAFSSFFPPSSPSLPQRAFTVIRVGDTRLPTPEASGAYTASLSCLWKLFRKICAGRPWSVWLLQKGKREVTAQRRPAQGERENRVFPVKRQTVWCGMQSLPHEKCPGRARRENARKIHVADLRGGPPHDRKGEGGTYFRRASRVSLMASMLPEPSSSM